MTYHQLMTEDGKVAIVKAVVDTLRQLSGWSDADRSEEDLRDLANQVESRGAELAGDGWTCPMCQELQCDDDCPLAVVRTAS